jgi:predicted RNA-binding Zn ribbon-like protein
MASELPTGQLYRVGDEQTWWFDSGSVALDFAHTGGFASEHELLAGSAALAGWVSVRFPEIVAAASDRDLIDARTLREAIARVARSIADRSTPSPEDVDVINLFAATPDIPPALDGGSRQAGRSRARVGQAFAAIARAGIQVFDGANLERVRECAAEDCELVFFDESRSNNRRWCSMQRCGNRAKVRAHRSRAHEVVSNSAEAWRTSRLP